MENELQRFWMHQALFGQNTSEILQALTGLSQMDDPKSGWLIQLVMTQRKSLLWKNYPLRELQNYFN